MRFKQGQPQGGHTMLVLSRKPGEKIVVTLPSGDMTITVIDSFDGLVRLGFTAPREIPIIRAELLDHKKGSSTLPE